MSFDKAYPNRKDRRRQYHGNKAFDHTCRPGGSCPWCRRNRLHSAIKRELTMKEAQNVQRAMDLDDFAADAVDAISAMSAWNTFLTVMAEKGYSEADIEEGCSQIAKRAGRIG